TILDTLHQVLSEEPVPPRRLWSKVPRDLETICLKCLAKAPRRRYASAEALAEDLDRFLASQPIVARPAGRLERTLKWCRRRPAAAALLAVSALAVASLLAAGVWFTGELQEERDFADQPRRRAEANPTKAQEESPRAERNGRRARVQQQAADSQRRRAEQNFDRACAAVDEMLTEVGDNWLVNIPYMEKVRRALLLKALTFSKELLRQKSADP